MSAKDSPDTAIPAGYRTLVPGGPPKPAHKPATKAAAAPKAAQPDPAKPTGNPEAGKSAAKPETTPQDDPTRFGDWQIKGRCIDF